MYLDRRMEGLGEGGRRVSLGKGDELGPERMWPAVIPHNEADCARLHSVSTRQADTSCWLQPATQEAARAARPTQPVPSSRQRCPGQAQDKWSISSGQLRSWRVGVER